MDDAVSTSELHAEGSLVENTSAETFPLARQANAGKLDGQKQIIAWNRPIGTRRHAEQIDLFSGGLYLPHHGSVMGK